jgi:hypothetical protein
MKQFGIGLVVGVPTSAGNNATPSFPQRFGVIKEAQVEFSGKLEKLWGQNKLPDDIAASDMEFKGKAAFAEIESDVYNSLFFGDVISTGSKKMVSDEAPAAVAGNNFTVANGGNNFYQNFGLRYASTGVTLEQVGAGNEATGKYSVSATGKYTLGGNDAGNNVLFLVSYAYTSTAGKTLLVTNHLQGYGPVFELWLSMPYQGDNGVHLFQCKSSKMSLPLDRAKHVFSDFEFESFPNAAGSIMEFFQTTA